MCRSSSLADTSSPPSLKEAIAWTATLSQSRTGTQVASGNLLVTLITTTTSSAAAAALRCMDERNLANFISWQTNLGGPLAKPSTTSLESTFYKSPPYGQTKAYTHVECLAFVKKCRTEAETSTKLSTTTTPFATKFEPRPCCAPQRPVLLRAARRTGDKPSVRWFGIP